MRGVVVGGGGSGGCWRLHARSRAHTHTPHINFSDCHLSIAFQLILKLGTLIPCVRIISSVCIYLYSH